MTLSRQFASDLWFRPLVTTSDGACTLRTSLKSIAATDLVWNHSFATRGKLKHKTKRAVLLFSWLTNDFHISSSGDFNYWKAFSWFCLSCERNWFASCCASRDCLGTWLEHPPPPVPPSWVCLGRGIAFPTGDGYPVIGIVGGEWDWWGNR